MTFIDHLLWLIDNLNSFENSTISSDQNSFLHPFKFVLSLWIVKRNAIKLRFTICEYNQRRLEL